jgi:O-antigen/teichoic acid export membrane protein
VTPPGGGTPAAAWRRLAAATAAYSISNAARVALAFATSVVVARALGPEAFGRWALVMTIAGATTMILDAGLGVFLTRQAAAFPERAGRLVAAGAAARLGLLLPLALGAFALSAILDDPSSMQAAAGAVVLVASGLAYGCFAAAFRATSAGIARVLAIEGAASAAQCAGAVAVLAAGGGVLALVRLAAAVQAAQLAVAIVLWRRGRFAPLAWPSVPDTTALLRASAPFATAGLLANAQARLAPLMLGAMGSVTAVGAFTAAARIGDAARLVPHAAFSAVLPILAQDRARRFATLNEQRFDELVKWFSVAAALLVGAAATPILSLTYGRAFEPAAPALTWIAAGLVPTLLNASRKVSLFASDRERAVVKWTAVAFCVQAAACSVLIPTFGAAGAAAALALGEAAAWWPLRRYASASYSRSNVAAVQSAS